MISSVALKRARAHHPLRVWPYKPCEGCQAPHLSPLHPSGMAQRGVVRGGGGHVAHSAQCEVVLVAVRGVVVRLYKQPSRRPSWSVSATNPQTPSNISCLASRHSWLHKQSTRMGWIMHKSQHWGLKCIMHGGNCPIQYWKSNTYLKADHQFLSHLRAIAHPPSWWKSTLAAKAVGGLKNGAKFVHQGTLNKFLVQFGNCTNPFFCPGGLHQHQQHLHFWSTVELGKSLLGATCNGPNWFWSIYNSLNIQWHPVSKLSWTKW